MESYDSEYANATATSLPAVPQPEEGRYGGHAWRWYDSDEERLTILDETTSAPATVACVYASEVELTADQCREAAAVLLALACAAATRRTGPDDHVDTDEPERDRWQEYKDDLAQGCIYRTAAHAIPMSRTETTDDHRAIRLAEEAAEGG